MKTKKIEQKWFIWNSKFGKHFYALALWLAIVLSGWFYFFVSAQSLEVATDLNNAHQTIGRVTITDDGTNDWNPFFDFNWATHIATFSDVQPDVIVKKLWLNNANQLVYENWWLVDDGDRVIAWNDIYRETWHVSIWTNTMPWWKLNVVSNDAWNPELYIEQTTDTASNIRLKSLSRTWSIWAYGTTSDYFFISTNGNAYFSIEPNWNTAIRWDLYMFTNDIASVWDITSSNIITAVAFVYASDKNLKENIKGIQNPLETIYALNGYTFDWKKDWKHDIWLIAQEVEKVLPELVHTDTETWIKWVEYANMVALLIEWVKELWTKVEWLYNKYLDQQNKINELEKRLERLEIK